MIKNLNNKRLEGILEALSLDISFVDKNDTVKYWDKHDNKIFKRSTEALDKAVQDCHSQGSVNSVNQVLSDLKTTPRK